MFKVRKIIVVLMTLVYLLLLTACQTVPDTDDGTESSTPPSSSVAPITQTTVPPASSTPPTSEPATNSPTVPPVSTEPTDIENGVAFIFRSSAYTILPPDWSAPYDCLQDHLYWVVKSTKECILICEEPVVAFTTTDTHIYFVKESEPTNVYATPIGDFTNHKLLPETPLPVIKEGSAFIYHGPNAIVLSPDWCLSEGLVDHLYWVIKATKESTLICDEPVVAYTRTDTHVYFVKESEPTQIYRTPIGDFTNHQLFYESTYGRVSYMAVISNSTDFLQFVADEKKFVMLDMGTGESTVLMEQHHINYAYMLGAGDGVTWNNWIWFEGKPTENDPPDWQYFYDRDTGEVEVDATL